MQRQAGDQEEGVEVHQQVTWGIKQSRQTSFMYQRRVLLCAPPAYVSIRVCVDYRVCVDIMG